MEKMKVLFICVHNSARSQMAEAFLNQLGGRPFRGRKRRTGAGSAQSAGCEGHGRDRHRYLRQAHAQCFDLLRQGQWYSWVITVCDESQAEACPIFPGAGQRRHWSFPDPAALQGSDEEKLEQVRQLRDRIAAKVKEWLKEF